MLKYTLWLLIVVLTGNTAFSQLISDAKAAQTLLDEALLKLDELSVSYCVRFEGDHSTISQSTVTVMDIQGVRAVSRAQAAAYSSWGFMHQLKPQQYVQWFEFLRVKPGLSLSKSSNDKSRNFIMGGETEREEVVKKDPRQVSIFPQLDPFGLVFGTEYELLGRNSDFAKKRDQFLDATLLDSTQDKDRNVVGRWIGSNNLYLITVVFNSKAHNMPSVVTFAKYDAKEKKVEPPYGGSRTEWQTYGKPDVLVPKKTTIFASMPDGRQNESNFYWTWIEPKKWEKVDIDFEALAKSKGWHIPFDELFEGKPATDKLLK